MYHCYNCGKPQKPHSNSRMGLKTTRKCKKCGVIISIRGCPVSKNNSIKKRGLFK